MTNDPPHGRLIEAATRAAAHIAGRDGNALAPEAAPELGRAVAEAMAEDPALRHLANAEPWYASRVTWGALIAGAAPILALLFGRELGAGDQASLAELAAAAGTLVGAGLALYGRWVARTPIGKP